MNIQHLLFGLLVATVGLVGSWLVLLMIMVFHGQRSSGLGLSVRNYLTSVSIPAAIGAVLVCEIVSLDPISIGDSRNYLMMRFHTTTTR